LISVRAKFQTGNLSCLFAHLHQTSLIFFFTSTSHAFFCVTQKKGRKLRKMSHQWFLSIVTESPFFCLLQTWPILHETTSVFVNLKNIFDLYHIQSMSSAWIFLSTWRIILVYNGKAEIRWNWHYSPTCWMFTDFHKSLKLISDFLYNLHEKFFRFRVEKLSLGIYVDFSVR